MNNSLEKSSFCESRGSSDTLKIPRILQISILQYRTHKSPLTHILGWIKEFNAPSSFFMKIYVNIIL